MAGSLSDKAIFIYDIFFSADITQGQLDSQIKQSSLFRLAFEEVISYPNLLDQMKAHDRYDELIGIGTEAYNMIASNVTREENSKLEANCFIFITDENHDAQDFSDFLGTVSGHIGFGTIINNPKTSYDIADNSHAVDLILGNEDAIDALLNSPNGLNAFGKNPTSQIKIYQNEQVFKALRASLRFNQQGVAPGVFSTGLQRYMKKHGDKYVYLEGGTNIMYISEDMYNWQKIIVPNDSTGNTFNLAYEQHHGDIVGYDKLNRAWFFISRRNTAKIKWTKDFVEWFDVQHVVGNTYMRTLSSWDDKIWFYDYTSSNNWQLSYLQMEEGATAYSPKTVPNPNQISVYGKAPEDDDYPYMIWHDVNYNWKHMNKQGEFPYRVTDQNDWFYAHDGSANRSTRGITFNNGYFFITFGVSGQMGITRLDLTHDNDVLWTWSSRDVDASGAKVTYWYNYETNDYMQVSYANGVYIVPINGGYATSINGVVWDEQLFDVTYIFNVKGADERGFYGNVPGTNFVITSYDASIAASGEPTTTTSTTTAAPTNLPEGLTELECLIDTTEARVVEYNGLKMVFNDKDYYENTNYVVTNGQYKILNVPEQYPIAVLNYGKFNEVTYTGLPTKKHQIKVRGTDADYVYDFFYGDVTINVKGNFETVSLYYYKTPTKQGYLGMEKILVHQDYLTADGSTASDITNKVSDTSIYSSSVRNFDCVGNEALEQTDLTTIPTLVTPTTTTTPVYSHVFDPQTTTTSTTINLGDQNYTTPIPLTPTEYDIVLDGPTGTDLKLQGQSGTFADLNAAGFRAVLRAGTYVFNAPVDTDGEGVAIAFEGATSSPYFGPQHSNISYSGDFYKRSTKGIDGIPYYFYHGEIVVVVDAPFQTVNIVPYDIVTYNAANNAFSWDIVEATTPTTTAAPTTSTTTDPGLTYTKCMNSQPVITHDGTNVLFDGEYQSNVKQGMNQGTYIFKNVPQSAPMAILNYGKWSSISYTGEPMKSITHTAADGHQYSFYYGDITVNVNGDFGIISYETSTFNYSGGENRLIYSSVCPVSNIPTTSTTIRPTTTTTLLSNSILAEPTTTITTAQPTTTSTTLGVISESDNCLVSGSTGNTVAYTGGVYVFNGVSGVYGMTTGTYIFKNVSASHPIAFHNFGKTTNISYSGQYSQGTKLGLDGNSYPYYYGDVTVTVNGDFGLISYECWYHGYMGGRNNLIYDNTNCT
jgi:hypothetical protein